MIFFANSGSSFFLVWFGLGLTCLILSWLVKKGAWSSLPAAIRLIIVIFGSMALLVVIVTQGLVISAMGAEGREGLDYVIVLGAQVRKSGPALVTKYRLDRAVSYAKENPGSRIIVSGGQGYNEPAAEALIMKKYLQKKGIREDRIITEEKSRNTGENIRFSGRLLDKKKDKIGIITNNFHVYRAVFLAKKEGYEHVYGIAAKSTPLFLPNNMFRESFGICKDFFKMLF